MPTNLNILSEASRKPVMMEELRLLVQQEKQIPNSVTYDMRRYERKPNWQMEDVGMFKYHYAGKKKSDNYLELKFCLTGNAYCAEDECSEDLCRRKGVFDCNERVETVDVFSFRFTPTYLKQFVHGKKAETRAEAMLSFTSTQQVTHIVPLCGKNRVVLQSLFNHKYKDSLQNIFINSQIQSLLLYSLDCLFGNGDKEPVFACKFLEDERGRDTIIKAREVLLENIGNPITIKELARKVATNECYLKKGFKEMFGTTIFDFYQGQRMEHAKYLLYDKGLTVTDVSALLGYSSISHFSTAFKKHTGLKPCELLVH